MQEPAPELGRLYRKLKRLRATPAGMRDIMWSIRHDNTVAQIESLEQSFEDGRVIDLGPPGPQADELW